jgi:hypothetical protein
MKKIVLLLIIALLYINVNSQIKVGVATQINSPMSSDYSFGVGIGVDAKYMIANSIGIGFTTGYQHFFMANGWEDSWYEQWGNEYKDANYNIIPIRATFTYYFGERSIKPYVGFETGINKLQWEYYYYYSSDYGYVQNEGSETYFAFAPQAGLEIELGNVMALDLNLKYNGFEQSYISGKFGLVFNFGNN